MKQAAILVATITLCIMLPEQVRPSQNLQTEQTTTGAQPDKPFITIEKSLRDLQSQDPAIRMGAAMLLGKYQTPVTRDALLKTLQDKDVRIRYTALISLLEARSFNKPFDTTPILAMISDPDAAIRRQVSLYSGRLMSLLRRFVSLPQGSTSNIQKKLNTIPNYPVITGDLKKAFFDDDVDVRRNMMKSYKMLGLDIPIQDMTRLLSDPDREVRLEALPIVARTQPTKFIELAAGIIQADDPQWNKTLASELGRIGHLTAVPILQTLSLNTNEKVAVEAAVSLFQIDPSSPQAQPIYRKLAANALPDMQAARIISSLRKLDNETARASLENLLNLKSDKSRATAVNNWLLCHKSLPDPDRIKAFLQDESPAVRQITTSYLLRFSRTMPPDLIEEILFHPDEKVRAISFSIASLLPPDRQLELYLDLLIDESMQIRKRALAEFIRKRLDGWQKYAAASLRDLSKEMQEYTVTLLAQRKLPEGIEILLTFVRENPQAEIVSHINDTLKRKKLTTVQ